MYGIVLPGPNVEDGVPIVKGGNCEPGKLKIDLLCKTTHEIESHYVRSRLRAGDIVYAIRGSIGAADIVSADVDGANLTQDAARISPRDGVNGVWLLYAVRSRPFFGKLEAGALGATVQGINIRDLKRAVLPVPPRETQELIADYLRQYDTTIRSLAESVQAGIIHSSNTALPSSLPPSLERSTYATRSSMVVNHKEIAFEDAIEQCLLSTGYSKGDPEHFDRARSNRTPARFLNSSRTHSRPSGQHWRSSRVRILHTPWSMTSVKLLTRKAHCPCFGTVLNASESSFASPTFDLPTA